MSLGNSLFGILAMTQDLLRRTDDEAPDRTVQLPPPGEEELPPPETRRWVVRRKACVVRAVRDGRLTLEEACARYNLSVEEFMSWQRLIDRHGLRGLRTTRLQEYRHDHAAA